MSNKRLYLIYNILTMNLLEHITSVQDRMKMVGSEKASIQLDGENVIYSDWNNSYWIEVPKEDIIITE